MNASIIARVSRALRLGLKLLALAAPRNMYRVRNIARLRSGRGTAAERAKALFSKYKTQTRQQFMTAREAGSGAICVVIPCRNEEHNLPSTLVALAKSGNVLPIVIDNNSTDSTAKIAEEMGAVVLAEPKGNKMAATQSGIRYAVHELHAKRVLFTDGDTLPVKGWAAAMDRRLQELDKGNGAAVFGTVLFMFGPSHLANFGATWLSFMYTILRELRHETPIARGGNYGLSFDRKGVMEKHINALDKDLFFSIPDDMQIRMTVEKAGAAVAGAYKGDTWIATDNDRLASLKDVLAVLKQGTDYTEIASTAYLNEYPEYAKSHAAHTKGQGK